MISKRLAFPPLIGLEDLQTLAQLAEALTTCIRRSLCARPLNRYACTKQEEALRSSTQQAITGDSRGPESRAVATCRMLLMDARADATTKKPGLGSSGPAVLLLRSFSRPNAQSSRESHSPNLHSRMHYQSLPRISPIYQT